MLSLLPRSAKIFRPALAGLLYIASIAPPAFAAEQVIIASTGGAYDRALKEAWFDPFTKATGIEVVTVVATNAEMRAKAAAMVKTGNVSWDLYLDGEIQAASKAHREITEDLTEFCRQFADRPGLSANACAAGGALLQSTATLLAYRTGKPGEPVPESWADMWDTEKFPGDRAFPNFDDPWRVMAAALLADGVSRDELFPLDIDRAIAKLEQIRPSVSLWWKTGDQSVQGFRNGDYSLGQIWLTRAKAMQDEGLPIAWSYKASFLVGDRIALLKGAPNRDNALKLVAFWLNSPAAQAKACEALSCTPPSRDAVSLMSAEARRTMPQADDVRDHIIVPDAEWINTNAALLLQRWNEWIR
ncbi:ABC transporter substrate-binding protein [Sinorhizobium mexicanum]|uniref:ABC transporter substrate-binding protein n=1 Tax=Sinorhizobium mexicanum TaxID=375549 RepID=A0A859QZ19_9HYPH|nr:ABC transporter substrate-binding protein [Sinorhizobium mexicanum]MBP1884746.1 mannopine transport system substrate-binding protein [Sinorhizobium mexicanum]QLL65626.1 ABC transporter substrate-binding protein [Sinorhizobium mexicanum]